jgi:hypothetical protein
MQRTDGLVKVRVDLPRSPEAVAWYDATAEWLWAEPVGTRNHFRIDNNPFYAYGIAFDDIVEVRRALFGPRVVTSVVERGGHSNYRIYFTTSDAGERDGTLRALADLGCTYEGSMPTPLFAIDVPWGGGRLDFILSVFEAGVEAGVLEYDEGYRFP